MSSKGFFIAISRFVALCLISQCCFSAGDSINQRNPHSVVESFTGNVMAVIRQDAALYQADQEKYFYKIHKQLEPSVAFSLMARSVMDEYGKTATQFQSERFLKVFSDDLVETLGRGLASYSNLTVVTLPFDETKGQLADLNKVEVVQQIEAVDGATYVSYTMAKNESGEWKVVNAILNGVNLGKFFRNQFKQAMKQSDNNIDKVINNWSKSA